jgi:Ca2+-binding EF-hand superfamily protein
MTIIRTVRLAIPLAVLVGLFAATDLIVAEDDKPAENQPAESKSAAKTPEQIFAELDKNNDGKLAAGEVPADQQRLFERLLRVAGKDKGSDLTKAEFLAAFKPDDLRVPAPQNLGGGGGRGNGFDPAQFFQRMDRNKDGKLTLDEIPEQAPPGIRQMFTRLNKTEVTREEFVQAARGALGGNPAGGFMRDPEGFFKRLNPNAEGKVTAANSPEEFRPQVERWLNRLGRGKDDAVTLEDVKKIVAENQALERGRPGSNPAGMARPGEGRGGMASLLFRKLDTNGDGKLSKDEFSKAADLFDEFDRDHDGQLEPAELFGPPPEGGRPGGRPGAAGRPGGRPQQDAKIGSETESKP